MGCRVLTSVRVPCRHVPSVQVAAAFLAALLSRPLAPAAAQAPGPYEVVRFQENLMIPARDGVRLATDIYRPARNGRPVDEKFPILLHRTPYNKLGDGLVRQANFFASHGYVVVVQDTRGNYGSEGVFSKYYDYDAYDGHDVIQYLVKLPYVEPRIGMWGTSYGGHTQADAAKTNPRGLATIVVNQGGMSNAWDHSVRFDGTFEVGRQLTWAWQQLRADAKDPVVEKLLEMENVTDWYDALPLRKGLNPLSVAPNFEDYVLEMATHADYDQHWKAIGQNWVEYYAQTADIPMMHIGGWYDIYLRGTVDNFLGLSKLKKSPIRMLIGPWTHGGNDESHAGDVEFGPEAAITDFGTGFHLRWFDHFLKGKTSGVESEPRIRVFVMGTGDGHKDSNGRLFHGGYWRDETEWPISGTKLVNYYFQGDGGLRPEAPRSGPESTLFTFDPRHPVPTIGGGVSGRLKDGAFDQREREGFPPSKPPYLPLKARPDVVVFQTGPLQEDVQVVGPIVVKLYASSTAVDTDFTAKLVDVYAPSADFPTGFDMNLTDAIIRARYRNRPDRAELMEPGKVYEFTIKPFPTGNVFRKGHRIRIDLSSSNFPRFDVNPNTGEPLGKNRRMITADHTIYHSAQYPSHVVLPIVPTKRR
ncbi:MAG: CocE/NonD family hydrolase [Gemmatimonadetes bacterium]|nr:CocE/NonD family hydrolase [Gemmatimonadota bacterium]